MKIIKIIDSLNGQITLYDDDTYLLRKKFRSYKTLVNLKEDLFYDLIDSGFIIRNTQIEIDTDKRGIIFIVRIKMTFIK
jgi:hypothetical protein